MKGLSYSLPMKKVFFTFLFACLLITTKSQNLVPNYSFEYKTQCPDNPGQIGYAYPWYSPTMGSTDYFHSCGISGYVGVPSNVWGYQFARTGNGYAEIGVYGSSTSSIREYIQVQLSDTLVAGNQYCIKFHINHAGSSAFTTSYTPIAITEIGLLFSTNPIITTNTLPLSYSPQIVSPAGVYLNDTTQWVEISGIYTASGGERFITIGNFKDDISTDTITVANPGFDPQGYYYVDDVSVIDCDSLVGISENRDNDVLKIFPNPNNGNMTLTYTLNQDDEGIMKIYDVAGKLSQEIILDSNRKQIEIATNLSNGIYFYQLIVNDKLSKSDKIVIINK